MYSRRNVISGEARSETQARLLFGTASNPATRFTRIGKKQTRTTMMIFGHSAKTEPQHHQRGQGRFRHRLQAEDDRVDEPAAGERLNPITTASGQLKPASARDEADHRLPQRNDGC